VTVGFAAIRGSGTTALVSLWALRKRNTQSSTATCCGISMLMPMAYWRSRRLRHHHVAPRHLPRPVALGCAGTSDTKRVPAKAFSLRREEKLALLAGYVDADGSVAKSSTSNHGRCKFLSVNAGLICDLRELAIGCGLRVTPVCAGTANTNFGPS
jgi:hypothetical protein